MHHAGFKINSCFGAHPGVWLPNEAVALDSRRQGTFRDVRIWREVAVCKHRRAGRPVCFSAAN